MMLFLYNSGLLHVERVMVDRTKVSMANIILSHVGIVDRM